MSMMVTPTISAARAMPASLRALRLMARVRPIAFENLLDMCTSLTIGRDAAVPLHGIGPGVVCRQGQLQVAVELFDQRVEVTRARVQVLRGIEGVGDPQL